MASMDQKGLHKYIVWGLLASTVLFLILFILFTILFATKDDNSSSFLLTGITVSGQDAVLKDVQDKLKKKFHVNDIHLEVVGTSVTAVFSLRGKQTLSKVQTQINQATTVQNPKLTDGSQSYAACQSQCPAPTVCTTQPPKTLPTTKSTSPTSATQPTTTATTNPPPIRSFYCNDADLQREIVVVVDLNDNNVDRNERAAALTSLGNGMANNFAFGPTRLFVLAVDDMTFIPISTNFTSKSHDFLADWNKLLITNATDSSTDTLAMNSVFGFIKTLNFDPKKPIEIVVLTAHKFEVISQGNLLNSQGFFVAVAKATGFNYDVTYTPVSSTGILDYLTFSDLAAGDPFATLACQFSFQANTIQPQGFLEELSLNQEEEFPVVGNVNNSCQKVDILFVFDTSVSVTTPLLEKYKQFAINFASRFTMSGDPFGDNIQVGVIQFSDTATVLLDLAQRTLQDFTNFVNTNVVYTGGMTNTQDALQKCIDQLSLHRNPSHRPFVVFMTDGHENVGDQGQTEKTGQKLAATADIYFIGDGKYQPEDITDLIAINGHPEWIFNTTEVAADQLPAVVLQQYPCPVTVRACEVAYYAIEVSEAVEDGQPDPLSDAIIFVRQVAAQYNQLKPNASYQLMIYNKVQTMVPSNPTDYPTIKNILDNFNRDAYTTNGAGGHIDLDGAFYYLANHITFQTKNYSSQFHSSVIFAGEANTYTIDPLNNQNVDKAQLLKNAVLALEVQTNDIYVFDGSQKDAADYGADLWSAAVPVQNIVNDSATAYQSFATATNYFKDIQSFTCGNVLEAMARCDYNFIDVAVVLDIVGDFPNITSYLTTLIGQFATGYPSHFSMFAMGDGNNAVLLQPLQAWSDATNFSNGGFTKWDQWKMGTTTVSTTTVTTTTAKQNPVLFEDNDVNLANTNYPMNNGTLQSMFTLLRTQFGCNHYGYSWDRVDAPNLVMIVSDNFDSYTDAMWSSFPDLVTETWGCNDCAAKPQFFFMSLTNTTVNHGTVFQVYGDRYNLNLNPSIRYMSSIVNSMCNVQMPGCLTLDQGVLCAGQSPF